MKIKRDKLSQYLIRYDMIRFFGDESIDLYLNDGNFLVTIDCPNLKGFKKVLNFGEMLPYRKLPLLEIAQRFKYELSSKLEKGIELE